MNESDTMTPQFGPEHLARQHHARHARQRDVLALHRRAVGDRAHLEPHDLLPRHQEKHWVRRGELLAGADVSDYIQDAGVTKAAA